MDTQQKKSDQLFFYSPVQKDKWTLVPKKKRNKETGLVEETEELYPRLQKAPPRVTIAGLIVGDEIKFGYATCGKRDHFRKSIGRSVAIGRIRKAIHDGDQKTIALSLPIVNREEISELFVTGAKTLVNQIVKSVATEFEALPL